jgi:hypothetical protein
MKETFMKKRYLFVAVAILAAGLVFFGCDLLEEGDETGFNGELYTVMGKADEDKVVRIEFTVKKDVMRPQRDDSYKIWHDNNEVSSGRIDVIGDAVPQMVTFIPNAGDRFVATLDIIKTSLTFPGGILTSKGTIIMGYRDAGSGTRIDPVFETGGDLDSTAITLTVGESAILKVVAKINNGGGTPYYQWYRSAQNSTVWTAIQGAMSNTYAVPTTTVGTFNYCAKVGNATGGVITSQKKEVKIVASSEIVVGNDSGMTPLHNLQEAINTLLTTNSNNAMAYTVIFATDLPYPLFINKVDFPGAGKLTIKSKSGVTFTKGIYITRSDVELNGLKINIDDPVNAALYLPQDDYSALNSPRWPCAVLISDRYFWGSTHDAATDYTGYRAYLTSPSAVKNVSIVNCNIVFRATSLGEAITGICVDPYTAGRNTAGRNPDTRIKITGTSVEVDRINGGQPAQCFLGNNTDLINNNFISSDIVANIQFIVKLTYGDTITFANNRFDSTRNTVFEIHANLAGEKDPEYYPTCISELQRLRAVCATFGTDDHQFGELPSTYRWFIENLFAQLTNPISKAALLTDHHPIPPDDPDLGNSSISNSEYYIMRTGDNIIPAIIYH